MDIKSVRNDIVNYARSYINTKYHHQGRVPGSGLDCIGVVYCAYSKAGFTGNIPNDYTSTPDVNVLTTYLNKYCHVTEKPEIGDIILFKIRKDPQHFGIYCGNTFIHAYAKYGKVIEEEYSNKWKRLTLGYYALNEY